SVPRVSNEAAKWVSPDFAGVSARSPPQKKQRPAIMSAVGFSVTKTTIPLDSTKRSLIRCETASDKSFTH
ncbi:MAG: hypothetical protein ACK45T_02350, partial [Pseudanabaena sp.]